MDAKTMRRSFFSRMMFGLCAATVLGGPATGGIAHAADRFIDDVTIPDAYPPPPPETQALAPFNLQETGTFQDPSTEAYLRGIVNRLLVGWKGPVPDIPIFLVPSMSFASEVSAGGVMFIYAGTLDYMRKTPDVQTEDMIAFVLAHELSHILLGHTRRRTDTQDTTQRVLGGIDLASSIVSRFNIGGMGHVAKMALLSDFGSNLLSAQTAFPAWSRKQEKAADLMAIDLMAQAGYSLDAASTMLGLIAQDEEQINAQKAKSQKSLIEAGPAQSANGQQGFGIKMNAGSWLMQKFDALGGSHPSASARQERVARYIAHTYGDVMNPEHRVPFQKFINTPHMTTMLRDVQSLNEMSDQIRAKNFRTVVAEQSHLREPLASSQLSLFYGAIANDAVHHPSPAATNMVARAADRPDVTRQIVYLEIGSLEDQGKNDQALAYMAKMQDAFQDASFYIARIHLLRKMNRTNDASLLAMECVGHGDTALRDACVAASKGEDGGG
ncbi:M48 family metallopeptidase [Gluconacetobacter sp. Hr-1-5]|uniref:M48 family metallopeptidase n=1 Tax=Gluconacetobacter sp. Hr-1-5 TaxID=3395370 RepID=UPI003B524169